MTERQQARERTRIRLTVDRHSDAEPLGNGRVRVVEKITRTYEPFELTRKQIREWMRARIHPSAERREWLVVMLAFGDFLDGYEMQHGITQAIYWLVENEFRRLGFQVKE